MPGGGGGEPPDGLSHPVQGWPEAASRSSGKGDRTFGNRPWTALILSVREDPQEVQSVADSVMGAGHQHRALAGHPSGDGHRL